ncbi:MAG: PAS domain S-box protein [Chitinispirillaceae bacterium]|nr:PAS domain S-box protein [Chitinispirillaceae bacterium]
MAHEEPTVSCYTTSLLIKYAQKKNLPDITKGIPVSSERINDPREWTSSATWTSLAKNLEAALGNKAGIIAEVAQEILENEVSAFFPLFLKIAPTKLLFRYLAKYTQQYSNKNLVCTAEIVSKNEINIIFQPVDPQQYSIQMCDFNRGWTYAIAKMKRSRKARLTEVSCSVRSGGTLPCVYNIKWKTADTVLQKIKYLFIYSIRDQHSVITHLEENHQTLQKQYQEILSMKDFYSHIMDSMGEGIIWLNADRTITFTNNAFCRLIGLPENEVRGKPFESILQESSTIDTYNTLCINCRNQPLVPIEAEFIVTSRNGERHIGQTSIIWVTGEHYPPGYVISIRDITETRKIKRQLSAAENRYRSLYENSPAIIIAVDMDGRFLYANPAMTEQSGYTEEELKEMHFKQLIAPEADYNVDYLLQNLLAHPTRLQEVHFKTKDGIWKCIALNTYHIHDSDDNLAGISGIGVDVTETKRLNEQLIKSQRMDVLGQLAGGMAHDFGNMLGSIHGFSRMIADRSTDEKIKSYAALIERSCLRAHDLVKNLLAFSRGDTRESVVFDVVGIAGEVKNMMYGAMPKTITLTSEFPDEPHLILGDPGKIHQSIVNLCVNARDAIGPRKGAVTLRVKKAGENNNLIRVQVEDTGTGIPPDIIEKIFDPFFSTKKKTEGTGLGLSVVYGIMKAHKGEIYVESHPGEGTIFTLEFPAAAARKSR